MAGTNTLDLAELCFVKDFILLSQKMSEKMVHVMFVGEIGEGSRGRVLVFKTPLLPPKPPSQGESGVF